MYEYKLVVCDDQQCFIDDIKGYLKAYESESNNKIIVLEYLSGKDLLEDIKEQGLKQDIWFLDVDMPEKKGIDVAKEIKEVYPDAVICFITSYEDYAYEAYRTEALGYLVKPVKYQELRRMLNRCATQVQYQRNAVEAKKRFIEVKINRGTVLLDTDEILYIEKRKNMNEYINLTLENIEKEHICCAIGDPKHQVGVDNKKEWIKSKLKDGHVFRKLNARGKIFIEYEPIETAWIPISGKNYEYIYCLWVAGSFKGKGIGKELLEYAINDSKEKGKSGICTLVSKKKKPFLGEKKFFEHYGFKVVDSIADYELLALQFEDSETPKFNEIARTMKIDNQDFTIYYSNECPYVEYEVNELTEYAKENNIKINFIKIDSLEKAKNVPCIFNNWANFYKGEFVSNTILNANSFKKLIE